MYKIIFLLLIIFITAHITLNYVKNIQLYFPTKPTNKKYSKFFSKLSTLSESPSNLTHRFLQTSDNYILDTVYLKNNSTDKLIIYFHGNTGNMCMYYDIIKLLYNFSSVIIFDYRSYGRSSGDQRFLSEDSLQLDAQCIWAYAIQTLGYESSTICLFAESIGCSVALSLVSNLSVLMKEELYPMALILNYPIYSLGDLIRMNYPKFMGELLSRLIGLVGNEFNSSDLIQKINLQTKVIITNDSREKNSMKLFTETSSWHPEIMFIDIDQDDYCLKLNDQYIYTLADIF